MTIRVPIRRENDFARWRSAFTVLAITRNQPLFELAGVPSGMASAPSALSELARRHRAESDSVRGDAETSYAETVRRHVEAIFGEISHEYGEREAGSLLAWTWRHYIDQEQRSQLYAWWWFLRRLSREPDPTRWPLGSADSAALAAAVMRWFGPESLEREQRTVTAARTIPLTLEEEILTIAYSGASWDVSLSVDTVESLGTVIAQERAHRAWGDISASLTAEGIRTLLVWAEGEARAHTWPPRSLKHFARPPASVGSATEPER